MKDIEDGIEIDAKNDEIRIDLSEKEFEIFFCTSCMKFHTFEHVCDEQLDAEFLHSIQQDLLIEAKSLK